jgi:hypothetical protein
MPTMPEPDSETSAEAPPEPAPRSDVRPGSGRAGPKVDADTSAEVAGQAYGEETAVPMQKGAGREQDAAAAGEAPIPDASLEYWAGQDDATREQVCQQVDEYYETLLDEFRVSANQFVEQYKGDSKNGRRWRFWLIVLTGGLALLNVLASSWPDGPSSVQVRTYMTFAAAVYAVLLALATNIESFHNYADKKQSARESRELFLDAYREFEMLRLTYVYPFGYSPQGCFNLHALYRRLVAKDTELRRKLKQLTTTGDRASSAQGPK